MKTVFVGIVSAGAVVVGGGTAVAVFAGPPGPDQARVVKVVDGDTIDVSYDGSEHRVRLLNIDTPETKDPGEPVECLGEEATAYLGQLLEPGDVVRLEFDVEREDRYGRELAGVYEGDTLINAELARAGLGVPVIFEPNRKFYPEVLAAHQEARAVEVGLHSTAVDCTLAGKLEQYAALVVALEGEDATEDLVAAAAELAEEGDELLTFMAGVGAGSLAAGGLTAPELEAIQGKVAELRQRAVDTGAEAELEIERAVQEAKEEAEKKAKKKAEKKAKEEAEKKAAEEEAERKAAEEARIEAEAEAARKGAEQAERDRAAQPPAQPQPIMPQPPTTPAPQPAPAPQPPPPPVAPYRNCDAARAAGAAPVYIGTPGYGKHLDRDGDGIGCE